MISCSFSYPCLECLCVRGVGPSYSKHSLSFIDFNMVQIEWLSSLLHLPLSPLNSDLMSSLWNQIPYPFGFHVYFLGPITNAHLWTKRCLSIDKYFIPFFCGKYTCLLFGSKFIPSWILYNFIFWFQIVFSPIVI